MAKAQNLKRIETEFTLALHEGEQGVICGTAHVCGVLNGTFPKSVLEPGAFAKTLSERGNRVVLNVDHGDGLMAEVGYGEFSMLGDALVLDRGVLNLESTIVREEVYPRLKQRAEAGLPCGLSIEVSWPTDKVKMREGILHISEVKLNKVGIVDVPANEPSLVSAVMSEASIGDEVDDIEDAPADSTETMKRGDKAKKRAAVTGIYSRVRECAKEIYGHMRTLRSLMDEAEASLDEDDIDTLSLAEPGPATTPGEPEPATTPQGLHAVDTARLGVIDLKADSLRRYING
jgi:hypothetical protein